MKLKKPNIEEVKRFIDNSSKRFILKKALLFPKNNYTLSKLWIGRKSIFDIEKTKKYTIE